MRLGRDGIAGLICLGISLALLAQSFDLPRLPLVPVGPGFYPQIVLSFMAAMSVVLVTQAWPRRRPTPPLGSPREPKPRRAYGLVVAAFAIVGAYVWLLPFLGFRVATALFVGGLQAALERPKTARQWAMLMVVALGTVVVTYLAFETYLLVLLPRGAWTGW